MTLSEKENKKDIFTRSIIAGVLNMFNNQIFYEQIGCDRVVDTISIPWYYNKSGEQRFMQDFFTDYDYCFKEKDVMKIPGNIDTIPIGLITYTGTTIDPNRITSRYVKGNFTKNIDGVSHSMSSYLFSIPLTIRFDCELKLDSMTKALEVEEKLRDEFYKTKTFYVMYKQMRIPVQAGFPDTDNIEKLITYSHESEQTHTKITFQLELETYQPSFDKTTETFNKNEIKGIGYRLSTGKPSRNNRKLVLSSFNTPTQVPHGSSYLLEWLYTEGNTLMQYVDISFVDSNGNETILERMLPNQMYYILQFGGNICKRDISYNIIYDYDYFDVLPEVYLQIDDHGYIDEGSFNILNKDQLVILNNKMLNIPIIIEYKNSSGDVKVTDDGLITMVIDRGKISKITIKDNIRVKLFASNDMIRCSGRIKISDSLDKNISDMSENIEIV